MDSLELVCHMLKDHLVASLNLRKKIQRNETKWGQMYGETGGEIVTRGKKESKRGRKGARKRKERGRK